MAVNIALLTIAPLRGSGRRQQVSTEGGIAPRWRKDGRELFYFSPQGWVMAVAVGVGPDPDVATPRGLFALAGSPGWGLLGGTGVGIKYDVDARGERFLTSLAMGSAPPIVVAAGWQGSDTVLK